MSNVNNTNATKAVTATATKAVTEKKATATKKIVATEKKNTMKDVAFNERKTYGKVKEQVKKKNFDTYLKSFNKKLNTFKLYSNSKSESATDITLEEFQKGNFAYSKVDDVQRNEIPTNAIFSFFVERLTAEKLLDSFKIVCTETKGTSSNYMFNIAITSKKSGKAIFSKHSTNKFSSIRSIKNDVFTNIKALRNNA